MHSPLGGHRLVFSGHRRGQCGTPSGERVAFLRRRYRRSDASAVVLRDRRDRATAIGVKRERVLVHAPLRGHRLVFSGHRRGHGGTPSGERVTFLRRRRRRGNCRAVILRDRRDHAAAVGVERKSVLVHNPLRIERGVGGEIPIGRAGAVGVVVLFATAVLFSEVASEGIALAFGARNRGHRGIADGHHRLGVAAAVLRIERNFVARAPRHTVNIAGAAAVAVAVPVRKRPCKRYGPFLVIRVRDVLPSYVLCQFGNFRQFRKLRSTDCSKPKHVAIKIALVVNYWFCVTFPRERQHTLPLNGRC